MANYFEMPEGVSNPIDRSAVLEKRLDPLRRGEDPYGVKENGGSARQRHIRGQVLARFKANTADLWRNDCEVRALLLQRVAQGLEAIAIGAIRHQRADLSSLQRRLGLADERECGRRLQIDRRLIGRDLRALAFHADCRFDRLGQRLLDQREMAKHAAPDDRPFNLRKLEGERVLNVPLFGFGHGAVELTRLAVMISEAFGPDSQLLSRFAFALLCCKSAKSALRIFARAGRIKAIGLVGYAAWDGVHPTHAVALQIPHRTAGAIDWQLVKIGPPEPTDLSIRVGKQTTLQKRIVGEIDARDHVTRMERRLLRFGKEVDWVAIKHHPPNDLDGNNLLRNDLGRVQNIEVETGRVLLVECLNAKLPLRKSALGDRLVEIAAVKVWIRAANLCCFVPDDRGGADSRAPVEFNERRFALRVDEPEGMDSKPLHHPERARDGSIRHDPQNHVHAFRQERDEIPERVMRRGVLRIAAVRLHLDRMDEVGKLDRILDEEDGDVVANEIEIALIRIEFDGEAPHVAGPVSRPGASGDGA